MAFVNDPTTDVGTRTAGPDGADGPPRTRAPIPRPRAALGAGLGILVVVLAVAVAGRLIVRSPAIEALDLSGIASANGALVPVTSALAVCIDLVCGPMGAAPLAALVVIGTWILTRRLRRAVGAGVLIAVPWGAAEVVKVMVRRPRPDPRVLVHVLVPDPPSFSFPSGHTAFAAAICCAAILLLRGRSARTAAVLLGASAVLVTAWSRVALGVHHPSDVIASAVMAPLLSVLTARLLGALGVLEPHGARGAAALRAAGEGDDGTARHLGDPVLGTGGSRPAQPDTGRSRGARRA